MPSITVLQQYHENNNAVFIFQLEEEKGGMESKVTGNITSTLLTEAIFFL